MTTLEERPVLEGRNRSDPLVPIFTYGTLRVGQGNFQWAKSAVVRYVQNCRTQGSLYFVGRHGGYPVAKLDDPRGTIVGDVLYFDPSHPDYDQVVQMELGAGYEGREIEVRTPESETLECIAFHYLGRPVGEWIKSGDWVNTEWDDDDD